MATNAPPDGDPPVDPARSRIMAAIRGKDTKPEMAVRRHLHAAGLRYSLHRKGLPGRPDVVLRRHRAVVFVHGCFWHGHGCRGPGLPRTRAEWWAAKIGRNRERDAASVAALASAGWRVFVAWECDLKRAGFLESLVRAIRAGAGTARVAEPGQRCEHVPDQSQGQGDERVPDQHHGGA